jgi:UDP-N-acetylglucosamine--N-acetylmuramyl-(pentapeptide) pyrophosphoryl-undecaprenol N-acetylglucosamine transferase
MRVAIAAGGTGGHVYPAVAVAAALLARGDDVHWIGRPSSLEESEAKILGIAFTAIPLQGLKRRLTWENMRALFRFIVGRRVAKIALAKLGVDVLFALGSYVSAPAISAALALRLPFVVHEQNVVPGLVVGAYARKAAMVLLTKPLVGSPALASMRVVGMPLRPNILEERRAEWYGDLGLDPGKRTLFIFGGSQGAKVLCTTGIELGHRWEQTRPDWQILLQTGVANLAWVQEAAGGLNVVPVGHLREMGKAYACADVIVSRSGAVSCSELETVGKPVILVPYPHATRDHQRLNAESYVATRPGRVVAEKDLNAGVLEASIDALKDTAVDPKNPRESAAPVLRIVEALDEVVQRGKQ